MRNRVLHLESVQCCGLHSPSPLQRGGWAILARQLLAHTIQEVLHRLKLRTRQLKLAPNGQFGATNVYRAVNYQITLLQPLSYLAWHY